MSSKRRTHGKLEWLPVGGIALVALYLGWIETMPIRAAQLQRGLQVARGSALLLLLLMALLLWKVPRDGPSSSGWLPRFSSTRQRSLGVAAMLVPMVGLVCSFSALMMLGTALKQASVNGLESRMYSNKGKLLGTALEQVKDMSQFSAVATAGLLLGLWAQRQSQARWVRRLLAGGKRSALDATTSAGPRALTHRFGKKGNEISCNEDTIEIVIDREPIPLQTRGAYFASTWRRESSEGELLEQRLPENARLLVAGVRRDGQIVAPPGEPLVIFACGKRRDPRAVLQAVQARQWLLLALGAAGLALVRHALG